jgi:RNA polymerase sigma-70 factor (ECF subfamily)
VKYDKEQFIQSVTEVRDQAYRIAFCYLHNEADSMDAVCDAVEKAFVHIDKLRDRNMFRTWFIRIVINECKQKQRANKKIVYIEDSAELCTSDADITEKLDVESLLHKLPAADRILIYMKYYMGYTLEEIAEAMNMSSGTVKTRIYSNLKKFRLQLEAREEQV